MKQLVVQSQPLLAVALGALLQRCGARVRVVLTERLDDALRVASQERECAGVLLDARGGAHELSLAVRELAGRGVPVLAIASSAQELRAALDCGAAGCLTHRLDENAILGALLLLFGDGAHHAPALCPMPPRTAAARSTDLTQRQRTVLRHLCAGEANKDIGRELNISEKTVKTHVSAILKALGVTNRTQAAVAARDTSLVEP